MSYGSVERSTSWVRERLPGMNAAVLAKRLSPGEFLTAIQPWMAEVMDATEQAPIECWLARQWLVPLGFVIDSVERHLQESGAAAGEGVTKLGAELMLVKLAKMAHHPPPRSTHHSAYLWNSYEQPVTYTGERGEVHFIRAVKRVDALLTLSCAALRTLCRGEVAITSLDAIEAMALATQNVLQVRAIYQSFFGRREDGERNMSPEFFGDVFRKFKPPILIAGHTYTGANAGIVASQISLDFLIGTVRRNHREYVSKRMEYLVIEDVLALQADMAVPSIALRLLRHLGWTSRDVACRDVRSLARRIRCLDMGSQRAVDSYAKLVAAVGKMTASHKALIANYVERRALGNGLSGLPLTEAHAIDEIRRKHPVISRLVEAAQWQYANHRKPTLLTGLEGGQEEAA